VRVGHRQAPIPKPPIRKLVGGFTLCAENNLRTGKPLIGN
jgi:hypothetical protein